MTVALPLDELSANDTETKIIDLAKLEMASTAQDMAEMHSITSFYDGAKAEKDKDKEDDEDPGDFWFSV